MFSTLFSHSKHSTFHQITIKISFDVFATPLVTFENDNNSNERNLIYGKCFIFPTEIRKVLLHFHAELCT